MSYISSNDNRLYAATETTLGTVPSITTANRFPAVRLSVKQKHVTPKRRDKTGSRSFAGVPSGSRRETEYQLRTYLTSWVDQTTQPGYGPLVQAALGAAPEIHAGGTIASAADSNLTFQAAHGLSSGQAICIDGEMRFVTSVPSSTAVVINAPFTSSPQAGTVTSPTITYRAGKRLPTASIFDYWSPAEATQRVITGAAVDQFTLSINSDFHEFGVAGPARDVIDSVAFNEGDGGKTEFPAEPAVQGFDTTVVPGHLGQVWMGPTSERFYTLTSAELTVDNDLTTRSNEFGLDGMREVVPGTRNVSLDFELYAGDDAATKDLYAAARQRSPIHVMFQLGEHSQQMMGVYLKSLVPEVPEFDDGENRLSWKFKACRAQGSAEDELVVAFG